MGVKEYKIDSLIKKNMKGKVTFNKSGNGSTSARLTIPSALVEIMKISKDDRDVIITFDDGKLIIEKEKK